MKQEYRIAHLSDFHLSAEYFPERIHIVRSLFRRCQELNVDHIIITGDVTNQARTEELNLFRSLLQEHSLLDGRKVSVVIGNHDVFGGPYYAEDVLKFPSACQSADYDAQVHAFYTTLKETFDGAMLFQPDQPFPFVKVLGGVAIVGINSVARWHAMKNPIGSNGKVERKHVEALKSLLSDARMKSKHVIAAIHHHFQAKEEIDFQSKAEQLWRAFEAATMKLHKKKRLIKLLLSAGVKAILHGHVHRHDQYQYKGIHCFNSGESMLAINDTPQTFHLLIFRGKEVTSESISVEQEKSRGGKKRYRKIIHFPV